MGISKKWIGFILIAIILAAGAIFGVPVWETMQGKKIKNSLAALSQPVLVEKVDVSLWSKSISFSKVKARYTLQGSENSVVAESIVISGVGLKPLLSMHFAPGAISADSLVAKQVSSEQTTAGIRQSATYGIVTVRDFACDPTPLLQGGNSKHRTFDFLRTLRAASIKTENYTTRSDFGFGLVSLHIKLSEFSNYSLLNIGKGTWNDLVMNALGTDIAVMESGSFNAIKVPDLLTEIADLSDNSDKTPVDTEQWGKTMRDRLATDPIVVDGLTFHNLKIRFPAREPILLEHAVHNLTLDARSLTAQLDAKGFEIPVSVYSHPKELKAFAKSYAKPLNLSFGGKIQAELRNDLPAYQITNLRVIDANLGGATLNADFVGSSKGKDLAYLADDEPYLVKSTVTIDDKGLVDAIFGIYATEMARKTGTPLMGASLKEQTIQLLSGMQSNLPPEVAPLFTAVKAFLTQSGTLVVTMAPAKPIPVSAVSQTDPDALGLTGTHTPLAKK